LGIVEFFTLHLVVFFFQVNRIRKLKDEKEKKEFVAYQKALFLSKLKN